MNQTTPKIYLDYAATTPLDSRVLQAMLPFFQENFGNPSSIHWYGQQAEAALEDARESVARVLHCRPSEIIFTASGSESDNLALRGAALAARISRKANHLLISPVEHHAVSRTARQLAELEGMEVEYLPVDRFGCVDPQQVARRIRPTTALVSVVYANNEIGSINPIEGIGAICRQHGIPLHTDAVQAAAYLPVNVETLNVDFLSIGAHKFYGPKGVGVLYAGKQASRELVPSITGGGQEFGLRAGTQNIPYIVGLATALTLAEEEREQRVEYLKPLRDGLVEEILRKIPETFLTGHPNHRLPNHASFVFHNVDGNALLMSLDMAGFACSSGSACKTGNPEPSEVLSAIGLARDWALGSLRVTLGLGTTPEQVEKFLTILPALVEKARQTRS
ncbi:MAG: cysteine desulfurase [Anaerolineales bacterium]|jgi:cysteine desulfurase|nr:cysteine desulfurase [Anaerolineales bacterium]